MAAPTLLSSLPMADRGPARRAADDLVRYLVDEYWDERRGELERRAIAARYEELHGEIRSTAERHRALRLAQLAYLEGLTAIYRTARRLAYRRVELDLPDLRARVEGGGASAFALVPEIDGAELNRRAAELRRQALDLKATYRAHVTPHLECAADVRRREQEVFALIDNAAGDFSTTTGDLFQLLSEHGFATRPLTASDRGQPVGWKRACPDPP